MRAAIVASLLLTVASSAFAQLDDRVMNTPGGGYFPYGNLATKPEVAKELDLSQDLQRRISRLFAEITPSDRRDPRRMKTLHGRIDGNVDALLNRAQRQRLQELRWQYYGYATLVDRDLARRVGLSDSEHRQVEQHYVGQWEEIMKANPNLMAFSETHARQARDATNRFAAKLLNDRQKDRWASLVGLPFRFRTIR